MGSAVGSCTGHGGTPALSSIRVSVDGCVACLTLDRVGKRNALDLRCVEELRIAIRRLADDRSIRAVTVNGAGQSVFCAGLEFDDIFRIDGRNNPFTAACDELAALPAPTVCAVRDGAYGAGADLALACDFRVGTPDCRVRIPAAALGVHYDGSGLARSIRTMGMQGTRRLFLAAETLFAEDLLRTGFLDEIAPATDLDHRVEIRVRNLASLAPVAVRDLKRSIAELASGEAEEQQVLHRVGRSWDSADFREGATARAERRTPRFEGR